MRKSAFPTITFLVRSGVMVLVIRAFNTSARVPYTKKTGSKISTRQSPFSRTSFTALREMNPVHEKGLQMSFFLFPKTFNLLLVTNAESDVVHRFTDQFVYRIFISLFDY